MKFRMKMVAALAFVLTFSFTTLPQAYAFNAEDGCEGTDDGGDIDVLTGTIIGDEIQVTMELCGDLREDVKYRVRIRGEEAGLQTSAEVAEGDICPSGDEVGMMLKNYISEDDYSTHGPGMIDPDDLQNSIVFTLPIAELGATESSGGPFYVKADIQYRGILDIVPDREIDSTGCSRHYLILEPDDPDGGVCPCFDAVQLNDWDFYYPPNSLRHGDDEIFGDNGNFWEATDGIHRVSINDTQCLITDLSDMVEGIPSPQLAINFINPVGERKACTDIFEAQYPPPPPPPAE